MTFSASSLPLPGIYPLITTRDPLQKRSGLDNLGIGYTEHGEQFMLKPGNLVGVAEFVGARVSDACGIPACQPTIVTIEGIDGLEHVFGSRIESGVLNFDQGSALQWQQVMQACLNPAAFSAMLAVDLVLGNDDRHWNNWLVQQVTTATGAQGYRLRALDFSRAWPVRHPAQHPLRHASSRTWGATGNWDLLGVTFDWQAFHSACATISRLPAKWLSHSVLTPLTGLFLTPSQADSLCLWWANSLQTQVIEAIDSLENGVRP